MRTSKISQVRSAMGHTTLKAVKQQIGALRSNVVTATVNFDSDQQKVIDLFFSPDTQRILREAYKVVRGYTSADKYHVTQNVTVRLDAWETLKMAVPLNDAMIRNARGEVPPPEAGVFVNGVLKAAKIIDDFSMVQHVVEWLDRHASVSAIRHYFPPILSLLPEGSKVPFELTDRFQEPAGISKMIPLIREAIPLVASALIAPKDDRDSSALLFTFHACDFERHGLTITREHVSIHI